MTGFSNMPCCMNGLGDDSISSIVVLGPGEPLRTSTVTSYGPDIKPYFTRDYYYVGWAVTFFALAGIAALGCKAFGVPLPLGQCRR